MALLSFKVYLAAREAGRYPAQRPTPCCEGDEGLQAFVDSQDRAFKEFLKQLLAAGIITDPRLVHEAEALIADNANQLFNYGEELLRIASTGRGHLRGADALQAATEAAGRMWELLWRPEAYAGGKTWETRFPRSAERGGIRGTIRGVTNNLIGHYAQRLRKGRASVTTAQQSQIEDPDRPFDVAGRASTRPGEWEEWRAAIIRELKNDLRDALTSSQGGKHREAQVRNLRWAVAIADRQMAVPYQWRSMPEVMAEIPELQGVPRGGLQQTIKSLIDSARNRAVAKIGTEREQAVAHWLRTRGRRTWQRTSTEAGLSPVARSEGYLAGVSGPATHVTLAGFREYFAAHEGLLLPDKPARVGVPRINPFPATQAKLQRLIQARPRVNRGKPLAPLSPASSPRSIKQIPSPLQAAKDGFAGFL